MTRTKKLDKILTALRIRDKFKLEGKTKEAEKMTYSFIIKTCTEDTEEWESKDLINQILADRFAITNFCGDIEYYDITHEGRTFHSDGGYGRKISDQTMDRQLREGQLKALERSKYSLIIAIIAVIVSICSAFDFWPHNKPNTIESTNKLQSVQNSDSTSNNSDTLN